MKIRRIFDNIEIKIICLLLAIVMWLYVSKPKGTEVIDRAMAAISRGDRGRITFCGVPIRLAALEEQKLVSLEKQWEANPSKISLEVESLAAEVEMSDFRVEIKLTPGDREDRKRHRLTLTAENVVLPDGLTFVKAEPNEIWIAPVP